MSANAAVDDFDVESLVAAKSDQLNAADLTGGPIVARVTAVKNGKSNEQPMDIHLDGYRPWKPCKGMRRVLIDLWGPPSPAWLGRTIRLYREPTVKWAGEEAGGIRVSGMSDIKASCTVPVAVSRGVNVKMRIEKLAPVSSGKPSTQTNATRPLARSEHDNFLDALATEAGYNREHIAAFLVAQGLVVTDRATGEALWPRLQEGGDLAGIFCAGPAEGGAS